MLARVRPDTKVYQVPGEYEVAVLMRPRSYSMKAMKPALIPAWTRWRTKTADDIDPQSFDVGAPPMHILGIPDHIDRANDWPLSARCRRELALRDETIAEARELIATLSNRALRIKVADELADELLAMGSSDPPPGFPNAFTMSRDEMLDFLAERVTGFDPELEIVYPGAIDPTA
jgi:hypothetical protein